MDRYEYKVYYRDFSDMKKKHKIIEEEINILGRSGWDLVSSNISSMKGLAGKFIILIFKRK